MIFNDRLKNFAESTILFAVAFITGSCSLALWKVDWYVKESALLPFFAFAALLGGGVIGKTVRSLNPALLLVISGSILILGEKGVAPAAFLLSVVLFAMAAVSGRNFWCLGVGLALGGMSAWSMDIRLRLLLWSWMIVLPTVFLAWREFLHYRTWGAILLGCCLALLLPRYPEPYTHFPVKGALPALLIPGGENLRTAYIHPRFRAEKLSTLWEQFPFVEKAVPGTPEVLYKTWDKPFALIAFDQIPGHTSNARNAMLKQAWEQLAADGALILPGEGGFGLPGCRPFPVPGTEGCYMTLLKGKGQSTLSEMDRQLQQLLKSCGMTDAFMPPGVFKALYYEDVHAAASTEKSGVWDWVFIIAGAVVLLWVLFTLSRSGMDGSVWGNGCWFGIAAALLIQQNSAWEFRFAPAWQWLPLILLGGFWLKVHADRFARYMLGISVFLPLLLLWNAEPWSCLAAVFLAACSCGVIHFTLAERTPERKELLFCKYAAGCTGGVMVCCTANILFPGNMIIVPALLVGLRMISFFRF